jgi:hypothetical protein
VRLAVGEAETKALPEAEGVSRARRTANRLRKAASRGLAS